LFDREKHKYKRRIGRQDLKQLRDENGKPLCVWCDGKLTGRQQRWCGEKCIGEFNLISNFDLLADKVWERDQSKCVLCGLEGKRVFDRAFPRYPHKTWMRTTEDRESYEADWERFVAEELPLARETRAQYPWLKPTVTPMQVDHIIPVVEGGGCCGIENLRLLCHPCHAAETYNLRQRMKERNNAKDTEQTNFSPELRSESALEYTNNQDNARNLGLQS